MPDSGSKVKSRIAPFAGAADAPWCSDTSRWPDSEVKAVADEIARLGLQRNVAELELFGYTVVHADQTGAKALTDRALERACDLIVEDGAERPDFSTGATHANIYGRSLLQFLHRDRVFQELMIHPMALALVTYLMGNLCQYSGSGFYIKGPVDEGNPKKTTNLYYANPSKRLQLGLHVDALHRPSPLSFLPELCNVHWMLTDYDEERGATCIVPGSHRALRQPMEGEGEDQAIPIEAKAGSFVLFLGTTWHGSFPRAVPGLRAGLALWYCRAYMHRNEDFHDVLTAELLDGMPPRFATLMGADEVVWNKNGPKTEAVKKWPLRPGYFT